MNEGRLLSELTTDTTQESIMGYIIRDTHRKRKRKV